MSFGYGMNGQFQGAYRGHTHTGWGSGQDNFEPSSRAHLQLDAIFSDDLSGTIRTEMGQTYWGQKSSGGALGADGKITAIKLAYIDWGIPETGLMVRMGLQDLVTPAMASGNYVFNDNMMAVTVSARLASAFSMTVFWARAYNDNYPGYAKDGIMHYRENYMDNVDAFGFMLPMSFEGMYITPWGMYAALGPNAFRNAVSGNEYAFGNFPNLNGSSYLQAGMFPVGGARHKNFQDANAIHKITEYSYGWWAGLTGQITKFDPFNFSFDFIYGESRWTNAARLNRQGWFVTFLCDLKLSWGAPGFYVWYGSGDDSNPANGSERLPALDANDSSNYSIFALDGAPYMERDALLANNLAGTWGLGARLNHLQLFENLPKLQQSFCINYFNGTNSPAMAKKMSLAGIWFNGFIMEPHDPGQGSSLGMEPAYLTSLDHALEFSHTSRYMLFENFSINFEANYIALYLDTSNSVWGARHTKNQSIPQTRDAWNINLSLYYQF